MAILASQSIGTVCHSPGDFLRNSSSKRGSNIRLGLTRYGKRSIKALVIESGLLEVKKELLPQGTRTLIRSRPTPYPGSHTSHTAAVSDL